MRKQSYGNLIVLYHYAASMMCASYKLDEPNWHYLASEAHKQAIKVQASSIFGEGNFSCGFCGVAGAHEHSSSYPTSMWSDTPPKKIQMSTMYGVFGKRG